MKNRPLTYHPVHLIYRLSGSLPSAVLSRLKTSHKEALEQLAGRYTQKELRDERIYQLYHREKSELEAQFQQAYDDTLDAVSTGPRFLAEPALQRIVIDSWRQMEAMDWVNVYAVSVMPNHVHVLASHAEELGLTPLEPLMEKHKRYTGRRINQHLGREGRRVWDKQVFDRDIRPKAFGTVFWYILNNPVKAGLCEEVVSWSGNYWHPDFDPASGAF